MARLHPLGAALAVSLLAAVACAQNPYSQARRLYSRLGLSGALATYMPAAQQSDSDGEFYVGTMYVFEAAAAKSRANNWPRAKEMEDAALHWFKRSQRHGNQKAKRLLDIVSANDTSVLYVSIQYIMNGTKPPPESSFPSKTTPTGSRR